MDWAPQGVGAIGQPMATQFIYTGQPVTSTTSSMTTPINLDYLIPSTSTGIMGSLSVTPQSADGRPQIADGRPRCAVCGDSSFGKHYGVMACNGCKGFFRRSVWKKRTYKCRLANRCAINAEQRNACRACRFDQCLRVGMNPRAVQGDLNECRKNGVICTQPKQEIIESDEEEDLPAPEMISSETQTDFIAMKDESVTRDRGISEKILELVLRFREVCSHTEPPHTQPIGSSEKAAFSTIFYNPELISCRTPIDTSANRVATIEDVLSDYRRAFVLFSDLMRRTTEFLQFDEDDRMLVAKSRFTAFYWWMTALWAQDSDVNGVCYANGAYFPADPTLQVFPDTSNPPVSYEDDSSIDRIDCISRAVNLLNAPMRKLRLTDTERAIGAYLSIFAEGVPNLSESGSVKYFASRDMLIRCLHEVNSAVCNNDLVVAMRLSNIIGIYPTITDLVMRASDNMEISEVLQIVKFDEWSSSVRDHESKRLG